MRGSVTPVQMMRSLLFLLLVCVAKIKADSDLPTTTHTNDISSKVLPSASISVEETNKIGSVKKALPSAEELLAVQADQPEFKGTMVAAEAITLPKNAMPSLIHEIDINSQSVVGAKKKNMESQVLAKAQKESMITTKKSHVDVALQKSKLYHLTENIPGSAEDAPESSTIGFYVYFALSSAAILFIAYRVYRLRLSRAERKYGVQGDRSNQEFTPLPLGIEDINSDDEDTTVFELSRKNIRIL